YQIHFNVLQAGQYGAPQGRQRVIFLGARIGVPLPKFPTPTHYFKHPWHAKLSNGKKTWSVSRSKDNNVWTPGAPLYSVTVEDAISDLPVFDWINPHTILSRTRADKDEATARKASGIPAFDALVRNGTSLPGFDHPVEYGSAPRTRYQTWMRQRSGDKVSGHYTARFSDAVVERTVNVPLEPDASWLDLPKELTPKKSGKQVADGIYQRINGEGFFRTSTTTVSPASKGSTVLHPSQKRILTVRECARAQGFPDHWQFLSSNTKPNTIVQDQLRQIGNAVPVPLAMALGRSLGESLMERWEALEREGSPEL
ncbi:S-adenosyl-L-methionine-dependent methyltransferase, partial [Amylostereum chailletii]